MSFIQVPFGYLLDWLYEFTSSYGLALILFSLIVKLVLLPMNIKSKKGMLRMARVAPLAKALEEKYADDKAKYQQELMALYREEKVSPTGGCLWSLLPLLLLIPLYNVIREPITYLMHVDSATAGEIVTAISGYMEEAGLSFPDTSYFQQLFASSQIDAFLPQLTQDFPEVVGQLKNINFGFLGVDLASIPSWKFWELGITWSSIGLFLLPLVSGGLNMLNGVISQKLNNSVSTNAKGEKDADAAAKSAGSMKMMMYIMPLFSVYIGFSMPAAVTIYWIAQAIFGLVIDNISTVILRKQYQEEDAQRRAKAAELAALEAEKERIRAERRAANPDGITENTSKKKQQRKEREEREAASRKYAEEKNGDATQEEAPDYQKCPSGIPERPYCKGRNYDPNRYKTN